MKITESARTAIASLIRIDGLPDGAGARISPADHGTEAGLTLTVVPGPELGDEVAHDGDAKLFLDSAVASALRGRVLDAHVDGAAEQKVRFSLHRDGKHS